MPEQIISQPRTLRHRLYNGKLANRIRVGGRVRISDGAAPIMPAKQKTLEAERLGQSVDIRRKCSSIVVGRCTL